MRFREIEVKHSANNIALDEFHNLVMKLFTVKKEFSVTSSDDYFVNGDGDYIRYRHRKGNGELTIKRKLSQKDNNRRVEVNLPTAGENIDAVSKFVSLLGYEPNFCIRKNSDVYWVDNMIICYYVVHNENWEEQGRFIEIEASEDYPWESEQEALNAVARCEKLFEPLGISTKTRLKKSLFEMFRR